MVFIFSNAYIIRLNPFTKYREIKMCSKEKPKKADNNIARVKPMEPKLKYAAYDDYRHNKH